MAHKLKTVGLFVKDMATMVAFYQDVDTPEEVDRAFNRMVRMGAVPIIEPKTYPWGLRSCYVADPESNLIEIATWKSGNEN